ncbi:unnamed protein product [Allacma fusca]|uniref:Uncharacterized protein n=1 Tax=Allacma fusca TaxID=39272 RepID=A0A8J2K2J6_9HEXA|nr:unnamed protein product [Allacma fusca]
MSEQFRIIDEDEISIIEEITQIDPSSRSISPLKSALKSPTKPGPSNAGHTPPATPKNKRIVRVNTSGTDEEKNNLKDSDTSIESPNSKILSWSDQMDLEDEVFETSTEEQPKPEIRKSGRVKTKVVKYQAGFLSKFTEQISDPDTYQEAMKSRYAEDWKGAMDDD